MTPKFPTLARLLATLALVLGPAATGSRCAAAAAAFPTTEPGWVRILRGPAPWQIVQRDANNEASIVLEGRWQRVPGQRVQVRVAHERDNSPVPGCDWRDAELDGGDGWRARLEVPAGGLYRCETRVADRNGLPHGNGERIHHVGVGDIWLVAGQSNAVGYAQGSVADPVTPGVALFGLDHQWRLATHPVFDPTGAREPRHVDRHAIGLSPWLAFGRALLHRTGVPVGIVPAAVGGSGLQEWQADDGEAPLFAHLARLVDAGGGRIAGMVWYQGCNDTDAASARAYGARFARFVAAVRTRYGAELPIVTAQLNRFHRGEPADDEAWSRVREAQRQAARTIARLAVVPTLDLPQEDFVHTSASGNVALGERFARAALRLRHGVAAPGAAVDLEAARFADAQRRRVRLTLSSAEPLRFLSAVPRALVVRDEAGPIRVRRIERSAPGELVLELERAAGAGAVCDGQPGRDPVSDVRDAHGQAPLAFFGVEIH